MQELLAVLPDWLGVYLLIVNVATIAVYGADKRRAKQGRWRVPEKTLFLLAIVGGSVGALLGMWTFHHKTRHWYFRYGIPAILVVQLALAADIVDNSIYLTGGGALLDGLAEIMQRETGITTHIADDPLECVALGTGKALENLDKLHPGTVYTASNLAD